MRPAAVPRPPALPDDPVHWSYRAPGECAQRIQPRDWSAKDMAAFDRLPRRIRDVLNRTRRCYDARMVESALIVWGEERALQHIEILEELV